jgi:serine protease Do
MTTRIIAIFFLSTSLSVCFSEQNLAQSPKLPNSPSPESLALAVAAAPLEQLSAVFRGVVETAGQSIVHIEATQIKSVNPTGRSGRSVKMQIEESGSGVVTNIAKKQVVLTNRHVVEGIDLNAIKIMTRDRRLLTPVRMTTNEDFDLAVIEVKETLPVAASFGDSEQVQTGDIILTIGSPFGLDRSLSMGIISAVNRRSIPGSSGQAPNVGFFQIDAAVNPGSSGGPMLNLRGEVLGLVTAIATQGGGHDGIAFVLPAKFVLRVAEQLVRNGSVVKPLIGVGFEPEAEFSPVKHQKIGLDRLIGAKIRQVQPDSPASAAGLRVGDVILSFDAVEVEDDTHIVNLVAQSEIDKPVKLSVLREGQMIELTITPTAQISR